VSPAVPEPEPQIDLGLNILGYRSDYVPPWSADHLYGVARDMCNRALEAEGRVLSLTQLMETAEAEEIIAGNNVSNSRAQLTLAEARVDEAVAQNALAAAQADLTAIQTDIAERQNNGRRGRGLPVPSAVVCPAPSAVRVPRAARKEKACWTRSSMSGWVWPPAA
jgi:hypothetical protein